MNILLTNSTDIFAGGEDYVLILARYLIRRGHSVWVSALPGHLLLKKCEASQIPTIPIAYTGMERVFAVSLQLRKEARLRSIDIVHSNANYDRTCAAIAAGFSSVRHIAGVHSAHSIQHNITHWMRNRFGTDHFIADAQAVKDVLVHHDGVDPSNITVVPIGVEQDPQDVMQRARKRVREEMGISPETIVVGNVARLVPFKGHSYLLQSIAEVVRQAPCSLFLIIGDGELRDDLGAQAARLGITDHVRFLGFRDDLDLLYPVFDIYCHSSVELAAEAFPLAILRALATGLPIACTNVGGIGMMVVEGVSGHLTRPEDSHALAEALLHIIMDQELRASMGRESEALFQRDFHASAMANNVERVYLNAMSSRGTEAP